MSTPDAAMPGSLDSAAAPIDADVLNPFGGSDVVLVGRYTDADGTDGVQRFVLTTGGAAGDEVTRDASARVLSPSWMIRSRGFVFAVTEDGESRLHALREDAAGLTLVSSVVTGGSDACHVAASPDGRWLAVAHYTSGSVRLVELPGDGQLDGRLRDLVQFEGHGPDADRQDSAHAHEVVWIDERHFFCNDLGSDLLHILEVSDDGHLTQLDPVVVPAGFGPRHSLLRGHQLAVVGELSGDLLTFQHEGDRVDAGWRQVDCVPSTGTGRHAQPSGIVAFGDDLVLGNRQIDTLARFTWDAEGHVALVAEGSCGGALPRDVVVQDDQVWVALQEGNAVVVHHLVGDTFTEVTRWPVEGAARVLF